MELAREGHPYKVIAHETGATVDFIGRYVRANKAEMNAPRRQPRKRAFNLERHLKKITHPIPEALLEPLQEIFEAKWSIDYLNDMNVPSSVAPRLLRQYLEITLEADNGHELFSEFKNILTAAVAYQVHLYASFPGIPPETAEDITRVMLEGKPEEIKIVELLLTFQPWVDQNHFNNWKQFRKNIGGRNV